MNPQRKVIFSANYSREETISAVEGQISDENQNASMQIKFAVCYSGCPLYCVQYSGIMK